MLNFKSYKKFYFHCLANAELKPHTKVLKNLFHDMTLKNHIWPLYYHHILAARKLWLKAGRHWLKYVLKCIIIMPLIWDNVTEIKCSIFVRVWLLKNLFVFECLYFSEYDIRMLLFIFLFKNRPSIKYVCNWGNGGGSSKMCKGTYSGRGVEKSVIRYVRTKWMAPNKFRGIFFMHWLSQVH